MRSGNKRYFLSQRISAPPIICWKMYVVNSGGGGDRGEVSLFTWEMKNLSHILLIDNTVLSPSLPTLPFCNTSLKSAGVFPFHGRKRQLELIIHTDTLTQGHNYLPNCSLPSILLGECKLSTTICCHLGDAYYHTGRMYPRVKICNGYITQRGLNVLYNYHIIYT